MNSTLVSLIPTEIQPSILAWLNEVEEPAVRLLRHDARGVRSIAVVELLGYRRVSLDRTGEGARPHMVIVCVHVVIVRRHMVCSYD